MADDEQHEHKVEQADAGASLTEPRQCSSLRKNQSVVIKGRPCKIVDMSTSKTGKHGHAKVHLVGIDLFTGKKLEELCPSTHNMDVPHVTSRTYTLLYIGDDDYMHLYDDKDNTEITHIRVPEGKVGEDIRKMAEAEESPLVTILSAMGEEAAVKVDKNLQA